MPFRSPAECVLTNSLTDALALTFRTRREFERSDEVCQVVWQIAPFGRILVQLEAVLVWDGEGLGGRNVVERAFLLACCGGEGIDGVGLQSNGEAPALLIDVLLPDELFLGVAFPDAECLPTESLRQAHFHALRVHGILGLEDDAVVVSGGIAHHNHAASAFQLHATLVDVLPSHGRELAVVGIAPQCLAQRIMSAPWFTGEQHGGVLAIGFQRIDTGDVVPIYNACGPADDVVLIEALDDADEAVEAFEIDMVFAVPDGLAHVLSYFALLRRELYFAVGVGTDGIEGIP